MRKRHFHNGATCPTCGSGTLENGTTTFTASFGRMVMVVYDTPAAICRQCGEEVIAGEVSERFDEILADMRRKGTQMEVINYSPDTIEEKAFA